jgi:hypothetical protein
MAEPGRSRYCVPAQPGDTVVVFRLNQRGSDPTTWEVDARWMPVQAWIIDNADDYPDADGYWPVPVICHYLDVDHECWCLVAQGHPQVPAPAVQYIFGDTWCASFEEALEEARDELLEQYERNQAGLAKRSTP